MKQFLMWSVDAVRINKALVTVTTVGRIVTGIIATTVARCRCKSVFLAAKVHFVDTCFRFAS